MIKNVNGSALLIDLLEKSVLCFLYGFVNYKIVKVPLTFTMNRTSLKCDNTLALGHQNSLQKEE